MKFAAVHNELAIMAILPKDKLKGRCESAGPFFVAAQGALVRSERGGRCVLWRFYAIFAGLRVANASASWASLVRCTKLAGVW